MFDLGSDDAETILLKAVLLQVICLYQKVVPHVVMQYNFDFSKLLKGASPEPAGAPLPAGMKEAWLGQSRAPGAEGWEGWWAVSPACMIPQPGYLYLD